MRHVKETRRSRDIADVAGLRVCISLLQTNCDMLLSKKKVAKYFCVSFGNKMIV